jgi:hypothetical protein
VENTSHTNKQTKKKKKRNNKKAEKINKWKCNNAIKQKCNKVKTNSCKYEKANMRKCWTRQKRDKDKTHFICCIFAYFISGQFELTKMLKMILSQYVWEKLNAPYSSFFFKELS